MRRKFGTFGRRVLAFSLTVAMGMSGLTIPVSASAAETETTDSTIVYGVDCGDVNPETAPEDGPLGSNNSVTDQVYGKDAKTGYSWGIVDTVSSPLKNSKPAGSNKWAVTDHTWPYEFTTTDQTSKTSTNRYTKNQFESGVETRYLDYAFELENGEYYVEVGFTDPWGCSSSPSIYVNKDEKDEQVLSENFDVASNGGVVTGTVKVTNGKMTIGARGTGDANKAINMTYITIQKAGDATLVKNDADALSIPKTATSDLTLPTTGSKGGSTITWKSSDENVITSDGKVTRPAEEDAVVTLTAAIKKGSETLTKKFEVTVSATNEMMGTGYYDLSDVEVTDAYYDNALEMDVDNLLALDEDRLLAGFRETAGYAAGMSDADIKTFMKNKTRYGGGWENALIGGHTLGHYLSAVAQGVVNPGLSDAKKAKLKERLDSMISALAECQKKTEGTEHEGFLFGATLPNKKDVDAQFDNVEKGATNIATQAWVPWYTMHKILAGLVDSYTITGNKQALEVANKLGTWIANRANGWSDATRKTVLGIEYGGMNDVLYDLYKVTDASNKEDFKKAAHQFDETTLFEAVLAGSKNVLNGKHANTTIPKFLGALARYEVDNTETKYLQYAESFWEMVLEKHTYITGGNSEDEHFGADNVLDAERTNCNNETCNTYNMLKLSRRLFAITGEKKYADYYENTLINAIMSSQNHETGMTMYFQPMASGYQKVFGTLDTNFWCCTGTGMENFTKLQDSIYFKKNGTVGVNLYLASKLNGDGYTIEQTGDLSKSDTMTFKVSGKSIDFKMKLRLPNWVKDGKAVVQFNGEDYDYSVKDGYITIANDKIKDGAEFTVKLPMEVTAANLADNENTYAFKYGPFVLSAKLGKSKQTTGSHGVAVTVPTSKAVSSDKIGISNADSVADFIKNINTNLVKEEGSMNFKLQGANVDYTFTTHYNQDEENYGIYWEYYIDEDGKDASAVLAEKNDKRLEEAMIDKMEQAGRGQYEDRFLLTDGTTKDGLVDNGSIGKDAPDLTREAEAGGSFGYKMQAAEGEDNYLVVTYAKKDDGKPMKITVGDTVITDEVLDSTKAAVDNRTLAEADQDDYYQVVYKIPAETVSKNVASLKVLENEKTVEKRVITVMFAGTKESASACVCKSLLMMKAYRTANALTKIEYAGKELTAVNGVYMIEVPYTETPELTFTMQDSAGYITLSDKAIDDSQAKKLTLTGSETTIPVKVYAQDFSVAAEYTIVVKRNYTGLDLAKKLVKAFSFDDDMGGAAAVTKAATPAEKSGVAYKYETGAVGKAVTLDGTFGLKLLDSAKSLGTSYTISYWMKPEEVGSAVNPTLTAGTFSPEYWLNLTLDGKIWSHNSAGYVDTQASSAYTVGEWQHVALVVNGDKEGTDDNTVYGELYVNGKKVCSGNVAKDLMTKDNSKLYFGVNAWDAIFKGALDDVLLFNKNLSETEVQAIAQKAVTSATIGNSNNGSDDNNNSNNSTVTAKKKSVITVKNGKKAVSKVTVKKGKKAVVKVSVNSKAKLSLKKLTKKQKKYVTVTFKNNKLTVKGKKKGTISLKLSSKATAKYKKGARTIKVKVK